ncbi:glutamine-synthetase adenylyltransferase [Rhodobacteraceae bacterium]|nr:glutamine-synthetase adenylyltransferase [Paracoccaceae bacterium]
MKFASRLTRSPLPFDRDRGAEIATLFDDQPPELRTLLAGTAGCSPYLGGLIVREQDWLRAAVDQSPEAAFAREMDRLRPLELGELAVELRRAKRRVALLAGLADLGGVWRLEDVTRALSDFADLAVDLAATRLVGDEIRRGKIPGAQPEDAETACGMVALAMGKMGAGELNYSSDIDLICLFDQSRFDADGAMEARVAFVRATRKMAQMLSDITDEGYVFRTDLRLRPDAAATPVCMSMASAELYYEAEGRTWERAAYIKARPAGGDIAAGAAFLERLRPFVWRRHLDFAAIEDAYDMRLKIRDHKGLNGPLKVPGHNIKLGPGGIREIEFFTQTRQLIAGGRDPDLRDPTTVGGLAALAQKGWIPDDVSTSLAEHYRAHREIEHRLQMVNDTQTQSLPTQSEGLARIAAMMGEADATGWADALKARLTEVETLTGAFFAPNPAQPRPQISPEAQAIVDRWTSYACLKSDRARVIFARLEPDILQRFQRAAHFEEALTQFDGFLRGLPAGVQLFSLFEANPQLIDLIVDICATSPALAAHLSQNSAVLDAVLGGSFFAVWPGSAALAETLEEVLDAADDYEAKLDATRGWAREWRFRIGVHHLRGLIDAAEAGKYYAEVANVAVRGLWPCVTQEFALKYGPMPGRGACVLAMGSLGAQQLNAGSDLDLLVIYDPQGQEYSEGRKSLASRSYYARLTQALITAISAQMPQGRLYEVDMRLRPSGRQGPVATAITSFESYQMEEAWTWEHLALTRARPLAGPAELADDIEALRRDVLATRGGDARVLPDLADMRARIFTAKATDNRWETKIGPGRLQDIELFAQSLALRANSGARAVSAQLQAGARAGLIEKPDVDVLASAYRFLWRLHAGGRLLTEKTLDMEQIGEGGRAFLLRETDQPDIAAQQIRLEQLTGQAAAVIARAVEG